LNFFGFEINLCTLTVNRITGQVNLQVPHPQDLLTLQFRGRLSRHCLVRACPSQTGLSGSCTVHSPAQQRPDTGYDLLGIKGLNNIIISAYIQPADLILGGIPGSQHNDGRTAHSPYHFTHFPSINNGKHYVQDNQVRLFFPEPVKSLTAIPGKNQFKTLIGQVKSQYFAYIGIIVNHQDFGSHVFHLF